MCDGCTACTCCLLSVLQYVFQASCHRFLKRNINFCSFQFPPTACFCVLDTRETDPCSDPLLSSLIWKGLLVLFDVVSGLKSHSSALFLSYILCHTIRNYKFKGLFKSNCILKVTYIVFSAL